MFFCFFLCFFEQFVFCLDVCCGTGTIGLCVAKQFGHRIKKLIGLEIIEEAVKDARYNAELNGIKNVEFLVGFPTEIVEEAFSKHVDENDRVVAVFDPRCGFS